MAVIPIHDQSVRDPAEQLDQFEAEWLSGRVPSVAEYFRDSKQANTRYLRDLVELDLEYRWKQFRSAAAQPANDDYGFPLFPRLEDYADVLPPQRRNELLVPRLVAEEYRVRSRWGDRPDRQSFFERFPDDPAAIETALASIDAEFAVEKVILGEDQSSNSLADQSTVNFSRDEPEQLADSVADVAAPRELGKYRLETLIDSGGFGEVWKAYDPTLKRHIAIKIPRQDRFFLPEELLSFRREAEKLATLGRVPGIVTVFDSGEHERQPYIVSDFIEGESLDIRLKQGCFSFDESAALIAEVAAALDRAHLKSLVHRDIKPSNILLDSDGKPFVVDFGLCVTEEEQLQEGRMTVGTFAYMSPEQARGESQRTDGRTDIYSLGVVLYRMLTGRLPFVSTHPSEYIDQILHREPRPPRSIDSQIPEELERICLKCLSKTIADRYTTAADLAGDLRGWNFPGRTRKRVVRFAAVAASVLFLLALVPLWDRVRTPGLDYSTATSIEQVASPFQWHALLTRRPAPLFPADEPGERWTYDEEFAEIIMQSPSQTCLVLGRTDLQSFKLQVDITKVPRQGESGLILGLQPAHWDDGSTGWSGQVISVNCGRGDRFEIRRELVELKSIPWSTSYAVNRRKVVVVNVPASRIEGETLEITVDSGCISECKWQGRPLPELSDSPGDAALSVPECRGKLGLVNSVGSVTFRNARFMPLQGE